MFSLYDIICNISALKHPTATRPLWHIWWSCVFTWYMIIHDNIQTLFFWASLALISRREPESEEGSQWTWLTGMPIKNWKQLPWSHTTKSSNDEFCFFLIDPCSDRNYSVWTAVNDLPALQQLLCDCFTKIMTTLTECALLKSDVVVQTSTKKDNFKTNDVC